MSISEMDIGWIIASVIVIMGVLVVILGTLVVYFESKYRATLDKKEWTIAVLTEHLRMGKEYDDACTVAAGLRSSVPDLELKALALMAGPRKLLETFLYLTDHVSIAFPWDPSSEPPQWKEPARPTPDEIQRYAAILVLWDREYISGVLPAGYEGYSVVASNVAMAVRAVYNRLPEPLKAEVSQEQHRS